MIQRYDYKPYDPDEGAPMMETSPTGEYVRFDDHSRETADLRRQVEDTAFTLEGVKAELDYAIGKIARVEAERDAASLELTHAPSKAAIEWQAEASHWKGRAEKAEAKRDALAALIDDYADHHDGCDQATPNCSCGFRQRYRAALAEQEGR